jgi:hypothetical protein
MLGVRVTPKRKREIEAAATKSGRSLSQEAELRIERSFEREDLFIEALMLQYGPCLAAILLLIGDGMHAAGTSAGFISNRTLEGSQDWLNNPYAFDQAARLANTILEAFRPQGIATAPDHALDGLGEGMANTLLDEAASGLWRTSDRKERAATIHKLLGDLVQRIKHYDVRSASAERTSR